MATLTVLIIIFSLIIAFKASSENDEDGDKSKAQRDICKHKIKSSFERLERYPTDEIIQGLKRYAERMKVLLTDPSVSSDLKPYDSFYKGYLKKSTTVTVYSFKIVIDKDLKPKFAPADTFGYGKEYYDDELKVCLTLQELEELIDKCSRNLMDKQIEVHRKKKVEDKLK